MPDPLSILRERLARGEISEDEYTKLQNILREADSSDGDKTNSTTAPPFGEISSSSSPPRATMPPNTRQATSPTLFSWAWSNLKGLDRKTTWVPVIVIVAFVIFGKGIHGGRFERSADSLLQKTYQEKFYGDWNCAISDNQALQMSNIVYQFGERENQGISLVSASFDGTQIGLQNATVTLIMASNFTIVKSGTEMVEDLRGVVIKVENGGKGTEAQYSVSTSPTGMELHLGYVLRDGVRVSDVDAKEIDNILKSGLLAGIEPMMNNGKIISTIEHVSQNKLVLSEDGDKVYCTR